MLAVEAAVPRGVYEFARNRGIIQYVSLVWLIVCLRWIKLYSRNVSGVWC